MGALALFPPACACRCACILGQHATVLPLDDAAPTHMCCRKEAMHTVAPISNYSISPIALRVDIRVGALHIAWLVARHSFNVACDKRACVCRVQVCKCAECMCAVQCRTLITLNCLDGVGGCESCRYFAEMTNHCGLEAWKTNSIIVHATSTTVCSLRTHALHS